MTSPANSLRETMSQFATGVAVVAGVCDDSLVGFSIQSFVSLSLDPPLVLFCAQKTSTSWPKIRLSKGFCINVLSSEQQSVSDEFAVPGKVADVEWEPSPMASAPILSGALAYIECRLEREVEAGDHTMAVCAVLDFAALRPAESPLLYFRGEYRQL